MQLYWDNENLFFCSFSPFNCNWPCFTLCNTIQDLNVSNGTNAVSKIDWCVYLNKLMINSYCHIVLMYLYIMYVRCFEKILQNFDTRNALSLPLIEISIFAHYSPNLSEMHIPLRFRVSVLSWTNRISLSARRTVGEKSRLPFICVNFLSLFFDRLSMQFCSRHGSIK